MWEREACLFLYPDDYKKQMLQAAGKKLKSCCWMLSGGAPERSDNSFCLFLFILNCGDFYPPAVL